MNVLYVDENDEVIGSGTTLNAFENAIRIRISRIFILNHKNEILIQKRSAKVRLPNKWDNSAAGHVDEGEDYIAAAYRELYEEMGIYKVYLKKITRYYAEEHDESFIKKRFTELFIGHYSGQVNPNSDEISEYKWIDQSELRIDMAKNPQNYTAGFIKSLNIFLKEKNKSHKNIFKRLETTADFWRDIRRNTVNIKRALNKLTS